MNNDINTLLSYEGNVTIKFMKNNEIYKIIKSHNNAKPLFFKYILQSITGASVSKEMPQFLTLKGTTKSDTTIKDLLSYRVPISGYVDTDNNGNPIARFTSYVPYGAIIGSAPKTATIEQLCIYNSSTGDDTNLLVEVAIKGTSKETTFISGTILIIEWNIAIKDINDSTSNQTKSNIDELDTTSSIINNRTLLKQVKG